MHGMIKNNAPVNVFSHLSSREYCTVKKNQKTGTVRMPMFSIFNQKRLGSRVGRIVTSE